MVFCDRAEALEAAGLRQ
jgi:Putative glycolipid-binding